MVWGLATKVKAWIAYGSILAFVRALPISTVSYPLLRLIVDSPASLGKVLPRGDHLLPQGGIVPIGSGGQE
jgi:hypothetical protein